MTPNLAAFAQVVRACEGTAGPDGYRTLFGGGLFDSFDDHPRIIVEQSGYRSSAAGAFQILQGTWNDFVKATGYAGPFDESGQNSAFEWLCDRCGASQALEDNNLELALERANRTWASLPGSPYGQPTRSLGYCKAVYARALDEFRPPTEDYRSPPTQEESPPTPGGIPADSPPTREEPVFPLLALAPLLGQLLAVFTPLAQSKLTGALTKVAGDKATAEAMSGQLIGIAQQATGLADPLQAVAAVRADADKSKLRSLSALTGEPGQQPAGQLVAQVEAKAVAWVDQVAPIIDKLHSIQKDEWAAEEASRSAAADRAKMDPTTDQMAKPLIIGMLTMIGTLMLFTFGIAAWQTWKNGGPTTEVWAFVTGLGGFAMGIATTIYAYRFGSSRESAAKTVTLSAIAARK